MVSLAGNLDLKKNSLSSVLLDCKKLYIERNFCLSCFRPFGQCYEFLTLHTVKKYFLPVIEMVPQFLENLTDEELKKEAKNEAKNDALSMIIKSLKNLASRVPGQEETVKNLEIFRLKMILR